MKNILNKIKIIYEDKDIVAIDKPVGILVHNAPALVKKELTVVDWIFKNYPEIKPGLQKAKPFGSQAFELELLRPGIVHRLDKETSGVLVIAKNQKAFEHIKKQFKEHRVKKIYLAVVSGWLKNDIGTINKEIGRSSKDPKRRLSGRGVHGKLRDAITEYRVLNRMTLLTTNNKYEKFSLLEIRPKTGRTHQIRVHFKYLNYPVVGDVIYNPNGHKILGFNRLALHAYSIEFKNLKNKKIKIVSAPPEEFIKFANKEI